MLRGDSEWRRTLIVSTRTLAPAKANRKDTLIAAMVKAHRWRRWIDSRKARSITDLAPQEGVTDAYVCRLLPLTCLAPDVVEAILDGRQPKGMKLATLLRGIPLAWHEQPQAFNVH